MLSKLRHFSDSIKDGGCAFQSELALNALREFLVADLSTVRVVESGTLGVGFLALINGRRRFLKTHAFTAGKQTLAKERDVLCALYGPSIGLEAMEVEQGNEIRLWLAMDQFAPLVGDFDIAQVLQTIETYTRVLAPSAFSLPIPLTDNFALMIEEGRKALLNLSTNHMLSRTVLHYADDCFTHLEKRVHGFGRWLCHGDLSPNNIMFKDSDPIVIDWEDAFWGIEGYDYLYWLTFLRNRQYLSQKAFNRTPWGKETEIAILILIISIKCEISFRSYNHKNNRVTFEERIMEVMNLA